MSAYYSDDSDLDVRVRRRSTMPVGPLGPSRQPPGPSPRLPTRLSRLSEQPVIINNNYCNEHSSDDNHRTRTRKRTRARSKTGDSYYSDEEDLDIHVARRVHYQEVETSDDDENDDEFYDFMPSYSLIASKSTAGKERDASVESPTPLLSTETPASRLARFMHVYGSQYHGDGHLNGMHTSTLTLLHEPKHSQCSLFKWM